MPEKVIEPTDSYPPGRVTDLRVVAMNATDNMTISISFTEPGDDIDYGTGDRLFEVISDELTT